MRIKQLMKRFTKFVTDNAAQTRMAGCGRIVRIVRIGFAAVWVTIVSIGVVTLPGCVLLKRPSAPAGQQLVIRQDFLEQTEYNLQYKYGRTMPRVEYITIHNTANDAPAVNERTYLNRRTDKKYLSFHFAVDEKEAVQVLPLNISAWHAGDGNGKGNRASIGIEICRSKSTGDREWEYRMAEENAVKLAAYLLRQYNLPVSALRTHKDWSGKNCPHRILDENRWDSFKRRVATAMK